MEPKKSRFTEYYQEGQKASFECEVVIRAATESCGATDSSEQARLFPHEMVDGVSNSARPCGNRAQ